LRIASLIPPSVERTPLFASDDVGVGQPANSTVFRLLSLFPAALLPFCAGVPAIGVGHPASASLVAADKSIVTFDPSGMRPVIDTPGRKPFPPDPSDAAGVGHPERSISDVRRTDARRRKRDTPEGVTHAFQVSVHKVDPRIDSLARNLLSKEDWRAALRDEVEPGGP